MKNKDLQALEEAYGKVTEADIHVMNKIKLSQVIDAVYNEEREIFLDSIYWEAEEEKKTALFNFDVSWNNVNTIEDIVNVLVEVIGVDQDEAHKRILNAIIEA